MYPLQDFTIDTAPQSSWHVPVSAVSQPEFTSDSHSLNPGTAPFLHQRRGHQLLMERRSCQSQGSIIEHGEQGDSIPPLINQFHSIQSVNQDGVRQITSKT
jgi:hypothetical protein